MTEILTESFCERCGTRYTFETAAPRRSRVGRVRVVSRGLRNFVMQDESTLSEAMADARSEEERAATSHQLDAFHKTFNFCLTCRQYTCGNCWNTAEGRCLTCSPIPGMELPGAADAEGEALAAAAAEALAEVDSLAGPEAWPEEDLGADRMARALGIAVVADGAEADSEAGADALAEGGAEALAEGDAAAEPWSAAPVRGVAPGQSLEDALAEYEASVAAEEGTQAGAGVVADLVDGDTHVPGISIGARSAGAGGPTLEPAPEPEPVAAAALFAVAAGDEDAPAGSEPEALPQEAAPGADLEPVAAALAAAAVGAVLDREPEPEPIAAEVQPEPEPVAESQPEPGAAGPAEDFVPQPAWPVAATAEAPAIPVAPVPPAAGPGTPAEANPWLTVAPDEPGPAGAPQWPAAPHWGRLQPRRDAPTTLAGRPLLPQDDAAALWAASAQEVLGGGPRPAVPVAAPQATPQPCVSCGLSLSTNARFCRRCGTRQG